MALLTVVLVSLLVRCLPEGVSRPRDYLRHGAVVSAVVGVLAHALAAVIGGAGSGAVGWGCAAAGCVAVGYAVARPAVRGRSEHRDPG
ncbi:hypothetical protein [Streptomyces spiramenti]|uniref:Integral membrane protein n=1 Tax=Streptomyces spiramenti TaxID=2720606 RepID=A0ABX1ALG9_9ACTN|nr:hypothetical protein [Streptomyces spiramenti]NJP65478.1 hypothetical protein [Streptomyces spiramenti]